MQVFANSTGVDETPAKSPKQNGYFEVTPKDHYRTGFFESHEEGDLDETHKIKIDDQTALKIAKVIFEGRYGKEYVSDKAFSIKASQDKYSITMSDKTERPCNSTHGIVMDAKNGTVSSMWSKNYNQKAVEQKEMLNMSPIMELDIADALFGHVYGDTKFFAENNFFVVSELENTNLIVVFRMSDDTSVDGGGVSLAIDRKTGTIVKMWGGE
jgi:hypothetical protein